MATNNTEDVPAESIVEEVEKTTEKAEEPKEKVENPTEIVENSKEKLQDPADKVEETADNSNPEIPEYLKLSGNIVFNLSGEL